MAEMLKSSTEYNRRAAIIEGLRTGRSATKIIRFFGYPRSTVYDVVTVHRLIYESFDSKFALRQCRYVWSKEFWPLDSPDLNPLVVERVTNTSWHPNVTSLRIAIEAAFVGMDSATLQYERFGPRIEAVIQTNGGYIE
ncbi:hypothetical protein ALC62_02825 [Cyphomyrmex costatus]|uniref:Uncharacterized protein n=1 Tax=Cyphomyrmex costatus TaxID=456900 RepID=A0A151IMP8_9HYME|nr:hypothetical protein ALC62_02825 [Cyphomyrmex costatus]